MTEQKIRGKAFKHHVVSLLASQEPDRALAELCLLPGRSVVNPLIGLLCSNDETLKWRAVTALGAVVDRMARVHMEDARIVMRRLMWMLNDESGGIGWGAPEAMGEIMARNRPLAEEYASMLVSYCDEQGNFIEHEGLQRGVLWAIGRLGLVSPDLLRPVARHLCPYLSSGDGTVRALAAWAAGIVRAHACIPAIKNLTEDPYPVTCFLGAIGRSTTVAQLAEEALTALSEASN